MYHIHTKHMNLKRIKKEIQYIHTIDIGQTLFIDKYKKKKTHLNLSL